MEDKIDDMIFCAGKLLGYSLQGEVTDQLLKEGMTPEDVADLKSVLVNFAEKIVYKK